MGAISSSATGVVLEIHPSQRVICRGYFINPVRGNCLIVVYMLCCLFWNLRFLFSETRVSLVSYRFLMSECFWSLHCIGMTDVKLTKNVWHEYLFTCTFSVKFQAYLISPPIQGSVDFPVKAELLKKAFVEFKWLYIWKQWLLVSILQYRFRLLFKNDYYFCLSAPGQTKREWREWSHTEAYRCLRKK